MPVLRSLLLLLLASVALALSAAGPAQAQSAGDERYADLLAQSDDGTSTTPSLTEEPQVDDGGGGSGSPSGSDSGSSGGGSGSGSGSGDGSGVAGTTKDPSSSADSGGPAATAKTRRELPNTGAEPGVVGTLGLALLLVGIGLRLRTADARL